MAAPIHSRFSYKKAADKTLSAAKTPYFPSLEYGVRKNSGDGLQCNPNKPALQRAPQAISSDD